MIILPRLITRPYLPLNGFIKSRKRKKSEKRKTEINDQLVILFDDMEEINPSFKKQTSHPEYDGEDGFIYVKSRISDVIIGRYDKETGEMDREFIKELFKKLELKNGR